MTFDDVFNHLQHRFPAAISERVETKPDPYIRVEGSQIHDVILHMRDELGFETLANLGAVDYPKTSGLCVVYHPASYTHKLVVCLKVFDRGRQRRASDPSPIFTKLQIGWSEKLTTSSGFVSPAILILGEF